MVKKLLIILILIVIFISGCAEEIKEEPFLTEKKEDVKSVDEKYCERDEDCVKARGEPCDCRGGGTAVSINKDSYAEYNANLEGQTCAAVMSTDISCYAKPICLNNKCTFDYNDYTICEELDYVYTDWCYFRFAMSTKNPSLCEKISHDEPNVKPSIGTCKSEIKSKEDEEILD